MLNKVHKGFAVWIKTNFDDRCLFLEKLAADLKENRDDYASLTTREMAGEGSREFTNKKSLYPV